MSYEAEQEKYREELETITKRYEFLHSYFENNPDEKNNREEFPWSDPQRIQLERILQNKYNDFNTSSFSKLYLEYKICAHRKAELEAKLEQSKFARGATKTLDYIAGITPQHVSGKIYKVEDGDGCAKFCLWFCLIDALIVFIYFLISGGK